MLTFVWLQIMLFCCMQETGAGGETSFFSLAKYEGYGAVGDREAGDEWLMCYTWNAFASILHIPTPSSKND